MVELEKMSIPWYTDMYFKWNEFKRKIDSLCGAMEKRRKMYGMACKVPKVSKKEYASWPFKLFCMGFPIIQKIASFPCKSCCIEILLKRKYGKCVLHQAPFHVQKTKRSHESLKSYHEQASATHQRYVFLLGSNGYWLQWKAMKR